MIVASILIFSFLTQIDLFKMYFWLDSYTHLYRAQNNELSAYPYHYYSYFAKLLYLLFDLSYQWYALVAVTFFIVNAFIIYLILNQILKKKLFSFLATLVFSSGYIGHDSLIMFLGDGSVSIIGLTLTLITIYFFIKSIFSKNLFLLTSGFLAFIFAIEIAPSRTFGLVLISLFILTFGYIKNRLRLNFLIFLSILLVLSIVIQYILHPSSYFLKYPILENKLLDHTVISSKFSILDSFSVVYLFNFFGSFGNLIIPSHLQNDLFYSNLIRSLNTNNLNFWLLTLPVLVLSIPIFLNFILAYRSAERIKFILVTILFSIIWGMNSLSLVDGELNQIYVLNGGILFFNMILSLVFSRILFFPRLLGLISAISILMIFLISKPDIILESNHRYLLSASFIPSLLISFFIPTYLPKSRSTVRSVIYNFVILLPIFLIIISHTYYSLQVKKMYTKGTLGNSQLILKRLTETIAKPEVKTIYYFEGRSKQLNIFLGESMRVGALPSEAVIAVHSKMPLSNVILAESYENILEILSTNRGLSLDNIHSYIYDGNSFIETSNDFKKLLINPQTYTISFEYWRVSPRESAIFKSKESIFAKSTFYLSNEHTLGIFPVITFDAGDNIKTLLPLNVKLKLKATLPKELPIPYHHLFNRSEGAPQNLWHQILFWEMDQCKAGKLNGGFECISQQNQLKAASVKPGKMIIKWEYDSYGRLAINKSIELDINLDGKWHEYQFQIPSGGKNLKSIEISYISFPGTIGFSDMKLSHLTISQH